MSFTGTPIFEQITPNLVRITGLSLPSMAVGTIGLFESTSSPDVLLPESFKAPPLSFEEDPVSLAARILVTINPVSGAPGPFTNLPPSREKTGETPEDFLVTVTNTNTSLTTQTLEIYVEAVVKAKVGIHVGPIVGPTITINEIAVEG